MDLRTYERRIWPRGLGLTPMDNGVPFGLERASLVGERGWAYDGGGCRYESMTIVKSRTMHAAFCSIVSLSPYMNRGIALAPESLSLAYALMESCIP